MSRPPPTSTLFPTTPLSRPPPPAGEDFHLREHEAVHEGAAPEGDDGPRDDARRAAENGLDRGLFVLPEVRRRQRDDDSRQDRKSTRLNSSHSQISYAVFCLT